MTREQFNKAMAIIAQHHSTEIKINMPKNHFVGDLGTTKWTIHITRCCPSVVTKLISDGFTCQMDENGLSVGCI
ncbi:MAG: hypothetical protein J6Q29_01985 [Alistipes sp.]|nr:hypothetical protein [Alistipes sp.]